MNLAEIEQMLLDEGFEQTSDDTNWAGYGTKIYQRDGGQETETIALNYSFNAFNPTW